MDMSKIEANKFELSPTAFNFKKMIRRVVGINNFRVDEKHQKFTMNIDPQIPATLVGDEQRLAQVIANLLSNAVKFTPEHGAISLGAHFVREENGIYIIQVEVSDTGIGISAEQQERLFHSFQQAESSTARKFGGTGLGLTISKQIVEMMGGRIWIESELGKGSVFAFTVNVERSDKDIPSEPLSPYEISMQKDGSSAPDAEAIGSETQAERAEDFTGRHILLAEDVEINREIVAALLTPTGLEIDNAENGTQAVLMFRENPEKYDIIFMDLQMPEKDGYEATIEIRAMEDPRAKQIPIIAMTANVFREDIEKCLEVGMNDHIGKPLDFGAILKILHEYL
jgi:CheY-like chemotaxis protein